MLEVKITNPKISKRDPERYYQPKRITTRHRALMRLLLAGYTITDAAKRLGMTVARAAVIANTPLFKKEMEELRQKIEEQFAKVEGEVATLEMARRELEKEALKSVKKLVELRDKGEKEEVQLRSAVELLNRAGLKEEKEKGVAIAISVGDGVAEVLKEIRDELKQGRAPSIEAEVAE